jgi:hypothetical protein
MLIILKVTLYFLCIMELFWKVFAKSQNGMKILVLDTDRHCLRMRQRNKIQGKSVKSMKFVSFKQMQKHMKLFPDSVVPYVKFDTRGKL